MSHPEPDPSDVGRHPVREGQEVLADGRDETLNQRMDRNWGELLQELRVTQTGVQILTGFLLTVPFQQRFTELDEFQQDVYLALVALAIITTGLIVAPVSLHRVLFRRGLKRELVTEGDRLARAGLVMLTFVLAGSALLIFDVVWTRTMGVIAGSLVLVFLAVFWLVIPLRLARRGQSEPSVLSVAGGSTRAATDD